MDHKDLMIGDVYDVASSLVTETSSPSKRSNSKHDPHAPKLVSQGSPHIDWHLLHKWWDLFFTIGLPERPRRDNTEKPTPAEVRAYHIREDLGYMVRQTVLELDELLLTAPQQPPSKPQDIRYLLILLASLPRLKSSDEVGRTSRRSRSATLPSSHEFQSQRDKSPFRRAAHWSGHAHRHSRVLSLILGQISTLPSDCHSHILGWLSRYPEDMFRSHVDMLLSFINDRISSRSFGHAVSRKSRKSAPYNGIAMSQMFEDILQSDFTPQDEAKFHDWQLKAACKVLQLFVRANDIYHGKGVGQKANFTSHSSTRRKPPVRQLIPTERFYNSQLDSESKFNPPRDFDEWEKKEPGLQLSQYPFLLTLGAKIQILEFDARKKMATKARQEFFESIMRNTTVDKYFHLNIRRACIIEDSLQRISEATNASEEEAKKALKVHFEGEEGVDAGGLRKEWFLLLVKELLDPDVGKLMTIRVFTMAH